MSPTLLPKTATADTFDSNMITILEDVIDIPLTNEVAIALLDLGYFKWKTFRRMLLTDVDELRKADGRCGTIQCMSAHRRIIERFLKFIDYKKWRDYFFEFIDTVEAIRVVITTSVCLEHRLG